MKRREFVGGLLAASTGALVSGALAAPVTGIALYEGADRERRLVDGARGEGNTLTLYTSLTVEDMRALNGAFGKKYGIRVNMWRASSEKVLQRVASEARAGRHDVDVIETNAPPLESLHREGLLQAVRSPVQGDLIAPALPAHREWAGSRLNVTVQAYNTGAVRREELPRRYEDLADPRWKGRLGIEAEDADWFAEVLAGLGEEQGLALFRRIVATNGVSVRRGHTLLTNLVASGEVPLALTVYNFTAEQVKRKGALLDWFLIPPVVARANGLALAKSARHPHAALLYYDFFLGPEGQRLMVERGFVTASRALPSPIPLDGLRVVDPGKALDQSERWGKLFDSVFAQPR